MLSYAVVEVPLCNFYKTGLNKRQLMRKKKKRSKHVVSEVLKSKDTALKREV